MLYVQGYSDFLVCVNMPHSTYPRSFGSFSCTHIHAKMNTALKRIHVKFDYFRSVRMKHLSWRFFCSETQHQTNIPISLSICGFDGKNIFWNFKSISTPETRSKQRGRDGALPSVLGKPCQSDWRIFDHRAASSVPNKIVTWAHRKYTCVHFNSHLAKNISTNAVWLTKCRLWVSLSLPLGNFSALSLSAISVKPLFESVSLHPAGLSAPLAMA